jgi:membrane-associated phospholipid phosphatase
MVPGNENDQAWIPQLFMLTGKQLFAFGLVFICTWGISFWMWHQVEIDRFVLLALNNSRCGSAVVAGSQLLSHYGMPVICLIYFVYLTLCHDKESWRNKRAVFLLILFSFVFAIFSSELLKLLFFRPRPIHSYPDQIRDLSRAISYSFPSGHATESVALVLPFLIFGEFKSRLHRLVKGFMFMLAGGICLSRVVLGAHYLSDVLAGLGWAFFCLPLAVLWTNSVLKKMTVAVFEKATRRWLLVYVALMVLLSIT